MRSLLWKQPARMQAVLQSSFALKRHSFLEVEAMLVTVSIRNAERLSE
jgi:hypothetical protein